MTRLRPISRLRPATLTAAVLAAAFAGGASAQIGPAPPIGGGVGQPPLRRPTVSPYLGLLNGGAGRSSALNYYQIVRPQQRSLANETLLNRRLGNLSAAQNRIRSQQSTLQRQIQSQLSPTGKTATFQDTRGFYPGR